MVWPENLFKAEVMGQQCVKCMSWSCKLEDLSGDQLNTCRPDVVICACNFDLSVVRWETETGEPQMVMIQLNPILRK